MTDTKLPGSVPQGQPLPPPPAYTSQPQEGYPPQAGYAAQSNAVFIQQAGPQPGSNFRYRSDPAMIICQHCNATVTTNTEYEIGLLTWAAAGVVCLVGCWLGCCFIPFCVNAAKDVKHTCPNCSQLVGTFRQIS